MLFQSVDSIIPAEWLSRGRPDPDFSIPNMGEESREHKKKEKRQRHTVSPTLGGMW